MENVLNQSDGKGLTFPELLSNSSILVLAGNETTATLLSGAVYLLLKNADKLKKLVEELDSAFLSQESITIESTSRLKYLPAVIEECLRFYLPAAVGLPREVPAGGEVIDGQFVSDGVSTSLYFDDTTHRSRH